MSAPKAGGYTPGPWRISKGGGEIIGAEGRSVMFIPSADYNAARIVACVNYCDGTPTDALAEGGTLREFQRNMGEREAALRTQRDELAAALRACHDALLMDRQGRYSRALEMARAALAKVSS